jgi:trk system potassium uptake protein TrkA
MRAVFTTASPLAVATARMLVGQGHNVIIVEKDEGLIEELTDQLDCGFLHGDGSRPATLEEVGPGQEDLLFCLGPSDQENIIASLVGRELGFGRVVTKIEDTDFENICVALDLQDTVVPQH